MTTITLDNSSLSYKVNSRYQKSLRAKILGSFVGGVFSGSAERNTLVIRALNDINLSVSSGEKVALLGHNGAGKSTLLRVIAGALSPTSGSVHVLGRVNCMIDITLGIEPEATGLENIYLRGSIMNQSRQQVRGKVDEIVEFSGLSSFIHLPLKSYSSGMTVRLAFSIATAFDCDILLMDEWLSVGDTEFQKKAHERLVSFINRTGILILATQSEQMALDTCSRIVRLEHGQIKEDRLIIGNR
jgi:lipopolysaccharide transport system ATP-binding protein